VAMIRRWPAMVPAVLTLRAGGYGLPD